MRPPLFFSLSVLRTVKPDRKCIPGALASPRFIDDISQSQIVVLCSLTISTDCVISVFDQRLRGFWIIYLYKVSRAVRLHNSGSTEILVNSWTAFEYNQGHLERRGAQRLPSFGSIANEVGVTVEPIRTPSNAPRSETREHNKPCRERP